MLVYWIGLDVIRPSSRVLQAPLYLRTLRCYVSVFYIYFTLPCRGLGLVGLTLYMVDWPTIVLQCLTLLVGSSDWPIKNVPDMTYNVFGGTLNRTLLRPWPLNCCIFSLCSTLLIQCFHKIWRWYDCSSAVVHFTMPGDLDLWFFDLKMALQVSLAMVNIYTQNSYILSFCFWFISRDGTHRLSVICWPSDLNLTLYFRMELYWVCHESSPHLS